MERQQQRKLFPRKGQQVRIIARQRRSRMPNARKILIVDDEVGIVEEVKSFLEEEGYEVRTADTAKEGIRAAEELRPDVVFVDVKLPDTSGIEVLKAIKEKHPNTKVVIVTGYVDQNVMDESEKLGRDSFLPKPFDLIKVTEEIERLTA